MKLRKPSAFMQVIIGLFLGLFVGLFFGEPAGQLGILGTAYIRLLQMTVLPYVVVSLIGGVGRLSGQQARMIGSRGGALILFLWSIALVTLTTLPLGYPDWEAASFFSVTLLEEPVAFDPLALYLTANPFNALANTIVPASVLFCIAVGVALIGVPNKDGLLQAFQNLTDALLRVTSGVVKLAPYGIFAITANAAGTLRLEELGSAAGVPVGVRARLGDPAAGGAAGPRGLGDPVQLSRGHGSGRARRSSPASRRAACWLCCR